jgi:hypothetical protein
MSKYGVIMKDPRTNKPKVRLYKDQEGNLKGDGICGYVKVESVFLAIQLLDDTHYDDKHTIKVERAKFEMKGEFNPKKKKARLTADQKKRFLLNQERYVFISSIVVKLYTFSEHLNGSPVNENKSLIHQ